MKMKIKFAASLLLGMILILAACSQLPTETPNEPTETSYTLEIQSVSVEQGVRVELTGTTTLPEGKLRLYAVGPKQCGCSLVAGGQMLSHRSPQLADQRPPGRGRRTGGTGPGLSLLHPCLVAGCTG